MRGIPSSRRSREEREAKSRGKSVDLFLVMLRLSIFSRIRRQETTARPVIPPETKANLSLSGIWVETKIKGSLRSWQD